MEITGRARDEENNQAANVPRRTFLLTTLFLGLSALLVKLSGALFSFLKPPVKENSFGGVIRLGSLAELPPPGAPPVHIPEGRFWLVHGQGGVSALHSSCTHLDCLFSWDKQKELFVCPCHGSEFAKDGTVLKGPATRSLDRFPVSVVDEKAQLLRGSGEDAAPLGVTDLIEAGGVEIQGEESDKGRQLLAFVQVDTGRKIPGAEQSL